MFSEQKLYVRGNDVTSHVTNFNILFRLYRAYFEGCDCQMVPYNIYIFFCPVHNVSTPCSLQAFGIRCISIKSQECQTTPTC